jgi:PilZ domain
LLDFGVALTQSLRPIAYIAAMDERRATFRDRVLKPGTIEFGGGAITCMVRNASTIGAALDVASPVRIPEHFTLVADGSHRPCQIIWRKRKRIGIEFD